MENKELQFTTRTDNVLVCTIRGDHNSINLVKREGFTTNKNYLGHNPEGVPYYYDPHLKQGEVKYIMTKDFKKLPDGKYEAKVEQVIRKFGKNENGDEDTSKKIISLELNVKDHTDSFYYINFCVEGYGDEQVKYANEQLEDLMNEFNATIPEELAGKVGIVSAKTKENGNTSMYFNAPKVFTDWTKILQFDCEAKFPCNVKKLYKKGVKYIFIVDANVNGEQTEEFVVYDTTNSMKAQSLEWVMNKLGITFDDCGQDLLAGPAGIEKQVEVKPNLTVKRITKDGKVYFNKRIGFEKKPQRKPQAWEE